MTTVPWIDIKLTVHNEGSRCRWSFRILFLCVSSLKPNNFWSNLNYQLSSYESAEVVTPSAHYNRTYWNQSFLLMHEMHVSSVWMPLVTASGCSLLLRSLWKQSVSLNKNPALCNVQWSQGLILRCKRLLWQSCHYKRDIKHHRTPSAHWRPGATLNTVPAIENCAGKKWQMEMVLCVWLTTAVLWFPASALMWSGQCGFRGQTGATAVWFGIFFPLEANRMSLMNHSVFQLSHLTILQSSPHR